MKNLTPVTREEKYLHAIATHGEVNIAPVTTEEKLLDSIVRDEPIAVNPKTRMEYFLNEIVNSGQANKNYILKLEEALFEQDRDFISADISEYLTDDVSEYPDFTGSTLEVGGEKFLYAGSRQDYYIFTRDGVLPEDVPEEYCQIVDITLMGIVSKYPASGAPYTLPVYLYNDSETRFLTPVTREEKYLHAIANDEIAELTPTNAEEKLLDAIMREETISVNPKTRKEWFLAKVANAEIISNEDSGKEASPIPETPPKQESM